MTNGEVFRKAAHLIETTGLYQRGRRPGSNCAWTAIYTAGVNGDREDMLLLGMQAAERIAGKGACLDRLFNWNDNIAQGPEDVVAFLLDLAFDEDLKAAASPTANELLVTAELAVPEPVKETVGV